MRFCFPFRACTRSTESPEPFLIEKKEKTFEYFLELPYEGRMMIINEMQADDRCRFTRCSKLCQKEAKASNNYIYGLEFYDYVDRTIEIHIVHYEQKRHDFMCVAGDKRCGYILKFDKKYTRYFSIEYEDEELWNMKLNPFKDRVHYVIKKFIKLVQIYQSKIKKLVMEEVILNNLKNYNFEIKNLKNLVKLRICSHIDILQFIPKIRKPMISLDIPRKWKEQNVSRRNLARFEQIYQVQTIFRSPHTKLDNQQLQKLSASWVAIDIGYLTEEDIFNFVRSWQNGTIDYQVDHYKWINIKNSNFDMRKLYELLRFNDTIEAFYQFEHLKDAGKRALLGYNKCHDWISFHVTHR